MKTAPWKIIKIIAAAAFFLNLQQALADSITSNWTGTNGTAWSDNGNWSNGVPNNANGNQYIADFTGVPPNNQAINNGEITIQRMSTVNATGSFTITNAKDSSITFNSGDQNESSIITGNVAQTLINNGLLIFQLGDVFHNITLENEGQISIQNTEALGIFAPITGSGSLNKTGSKTFFITANSTYSGPTFVETGLLSLGNGSTNGYLTNSNIILDNNGGIQFANLITTTYSKVISGVGRFTQRGAGLLILTGDNTFSNTSGGTISSIYANSGGLQLGDGGEDGWIKTDIDVGQNSKLIFNHSKESNRIFDSIISGSGMVIKAGEGILTLNGVNTNTGETVIDGGTLFIGSDSDHNTAQVGGNMTVNQNATLGGFGKIVGNLTLNNTATISPGASIGTLTVNGNYTQEPGTTFSVELNNNGESDSISVGEAANIYGGHLIIDMSDGFMPDLYYPILTASSVSGAFDDITVLQNFLAATVNVKDTEITVLPHFNEAAFDAATDTPNQKAVANYLYKTGGDKQLQLLIPTLSNNEFALLMDQLSAATYGDQQIQLAQTAIWFDEQMATRTKRNPVCKDISITPDGELPESCLAHPSIWVLPYASYATINQTEVSGLDTSMLGAALGVDFPIRNQGKLGVAFSFNAFNSDAVGNENSSDDGVLYQVGFYGDYEFDHWLIGTSFAYGGTNEISTTRNIAIDNENVELSSNYNATVFSEKLDVSYDLEIKKNHVKPFVALIAQQLSHGDFNETGDESFALSVQQSNYNTLKSQVGFLVEAPLIKSVTFFASTSWLHEFEDNVADVDAQIIAVNSTKSFAAQSVEIGRDAGLVKAGFVLLDKSEISITLLYKGLFASNYSENGGSIQIDFDFS